MSSALPLLAVCLLVLGTGAIAQAQERAEREVKVDVSESKAVITSESKAADREDELNIEFDNGSHNFLLKYETKEAEQETEAEVKVELLDLVEWRDLNGNGRPDPDIEGEVVQEIGLDDLAPQSVTADPIDEDGVPGRKITGVSATPDKYPDLQLTLTLYIFGEFVELGATSIEPTELKYDILIEDFPYQQEGTSLALRAIAKLKAEGKAEGVVGEGEEGVAARVGRYIAFFSWGTSATVDGGDAEVGQAIVKEQMKTKSETLDGGEKQENELVSDLYLLYPRGDAILHDPKIGVRLPSVGSGFGCTFPGQ